jgi:hypothetical protein
VKLRPARAARTALVPDKRCLRWLLLQVDGRPANALAIEVDGDLYAVCDFDEGDAAVHAVLLAVEGHGTGNRARAIPLPVIVRSRISLKAPDRR